MQQASDNLRKQNPRNARTDQQRAIDELERAKREIEDRLAQLREELQEEILAALEARFRQMLERQKPVTIATADLEGRRSSRSRTRAEQLTCTNLSKEETALAEMAQVALDIIVEEGTTVAFPRVVANLRDDLRSVARLLGEQNTGPYTQQMQKEIERTLEELIEALQKAQKENEDGGDGGGGGGQQQNPPLVPDSAELKLLKAAQLRVNRRTEGFDRHRPAVLDPPMKREIGDISKRQQGVADITQEMIDRK